MAFEIEMYPLGPESKALALAELRETEENKKNGIEALKKLLEKEPTLYFRTDDDFLLIFLRPCKFYPESALALMKRVADFKEKHTILHNLLPEQEKQTIYESNVINIMKGRDHKRRRILFMNCGKIWDPSKCSTDQMFRILYLIHEAAMLEPETQVNGVVVIMDFDGLSMKQVMAMTPSFSMRLLSFIQEAIPIRMKEVHIVKQPFMFNMVWTIFKPLVKEKLKNRLFFHGTKMSSLHKFLDPSHLPADYDGKLPKMDYTCKDWYPVIEAHRKTVEDWNSFGWRKN